MSRRIARTCVVLIALCAVLPAGDKWSSLITDHGLPGNEIQFIKEEDQGLLWIGTLTGLAAYRDGKVSVPVKDVQIWDILKIGNNKYWVGTSNGVVLLEGEKQTVSLAGNTVAPLIPYDTTTVWAISKDLRTEQNTLVEYKGERWEPVEKFQKAKVVDLKRTSDGTLWVLVDADGAYAIDPKNGPDKAIRYLEGRNLTTLAEDSKKRIWFGSWGQGVFVLEGGKVTRYLDREKSSIFAIVEDAKGTIWVTTSASGLYRFDGTNWTNDLKSEGGINMLVATADGRVWISSQTVGGLRYWDGKKWQVSLESQLPIRCLVETKNKQLWAGGVLDGVHVRK